jgi:1-phosphofructokinase family hexose kinase
MILTVTANAALDRVLFIDRFEPTGVMRAQRMVESVGGKGLDASVVLQTLQAPNKAVSFMAGRTGHALVEIMEQYGIQSDLIWIDGDIRTANVVVETELHRHSHIMTTGYSVTHADCDRFLERVRANLDHVHWIIMGGSLPAGAYPDLYRRVIDIGRQHGAKTLIDVPGQPALEALPAVPDILKMNRSEFTNTFDLHFDSLLELGFAARVLMVERKLSNLLITCGSDGILAVTRQNIYIATAPSQQAVNAAGAGDAVSASLVHRLILGDSWPESLRWAAATSAAVVLTEGTADCNMQDIERIYPHTEVKSLAIH